MEDSEAEEVVAVVAELDRLWRVGASLPTLRVTLDIIMEAE